MIDHLILGPENHGVTRHGAALAGPRRTRLAAPGPEASALREYLRAASGPVHVHLTDHLLGEDHAGIERGLGVLADAPVDVHVTLHDIPQPAEGAARFTRRRALYGRLCAVAASVQVCSESERRMLSEMTDREDIGVVPLPVDVDDARIARARAAWGRVGGDGPLGVLGFIHPGKNPALAIEVAAATGRDVLLIGAVVAGHEEYITDLCAEARRRGVSVEATGFLDEDALDTAIGGVAVPLAPHLHVSASGSVGRWLVAGRRPLLLPTPWAQELAETAPWAVQIVAADGLLDATVAMLANPEATWIGDRRDGLVTTDAAAAAQARFLQAVTRD